VRGGCLFAGRFLRSLGLKVQTPPRQSPASLQSDNKGAGKHLDWRHRLRWALRRHDRAGGGLAESVHLPRGAILGGLEESGVILRCASILLRRFLARDRRGA
jgi:hypothetical protein